MECNQPHCFLLCNLMIATIPQRENDAKGRTDGEPDLYQPGKACGLLLGVPDRFLPIITHDALTRNVENQGAVSSPLVEMFPSIISASSHVCSKGVEIQTWLFHKLSSQSW